MADGLEYMEESMKNGKIYYSDGSLIIRSMKETDIQAILEIFTSQGWEKPLWVLQKYYDEDLTESRLLFVAEWEGQVAGYTTLMKEAEHGPFAYNGIPYVCDFNVFKRYQRRGIGSKIMDCAEKAAFEKHDSICLGVGLYTDYGNAQRMYAKRGYIPDGSGVWYKNINLEPGEPCVNDDDLVLYLIKNKP